jgi:hypothetical protein
MSRTSPSLTRARIFQIAWDVRQGEADPDDARRLIALYCEPNNEAPRELVDHIKSSFRAYVSGEASSLDSAFGLKRRRGRTPSNEQARINIAVAVLRQRLLGKSYEDALADTEELLKIGRTKITEAWSACKLEALVTVRLGRPNDRPWSPVEQRRLIAIYESGKTRTLKRTDSA